MDNPAHPFVILVDSIKLSTGNLCSEIIFSSDYLLLGNSRIVNIHKEGMWLPQWLHLKKGHIRKNLTQNGEAQRSSWEQRRRRRRRRIVNAQNIGQSILINNWKILLSMYLWKTVIRLFQLLTETGCVPAVHLQLTMTTNRYLSNAPTEKNNPIQAARSETPMKPTSTTTPLLLFLICFAFYNKFSVNCNRFSSDCFELLPQYAFRRFVWKCNGINFQRKQQDLWRQEKK